MITNIDVYSELIQKDFSVERSIADCKLGNNIKIFERLFWLGGVKEYFGTNQAYLIKKNISSKAKLFMPKLDIIGVDDITLGELEKIYHIIISNWIFIMIYLIIDVQFYLIKCLKNHIYHNLTVRIDIQGNSF